MKKIVIAAALLAALAAPASAERRFPQVYTTFEACAEAAAFGSSNAYSGVCVAVEGGWSIVWTFKKATGHR